MAVVGIREVGGGEVVVDRPDMVVVEDLADRMPADIAAAVVGEVVGEIVVVMAPEEP